MIDDETAVALAPSARRPPAGASSRSLPDPLLALTYDGTCLD